MNAAVTQAIEEIEVTFPDATVTIKEDAAGVWVTVDPVDLGPNWTPSSTAFTFHLASTYPYADVYPHFLGANVVRTEGGGYVEAVTPNAAWDGHPAVQVSRRSSKWNAVNDTAALKGLRVLDWLRAQ